MPFFRRKERPSSSRPPTAPEIPELRLLGNQSLTSLAGPHRFGLSDSTDKEPVRSQSALGKEKNGNGNGNTHSGIVSANGYSKSRNGQTEDSDRLVKERKFGTMQNISSAAAGGNQEASQPSVMGHRSPSSSLSRSMSQGAVPYHLPWTRNLVRDDSGGMNEVEGVESQSNESNQLRTVPTRRKMGPPPSTVNNAPGLAALFNRPTDFRVSPNSIPQPTASQRRHVIDTARSQSLRRAKAPAELNLMLIGATGTGKTSFIRTFLATCNLSLCTEEAKNAAAFFGISKDTSHPSHDMDPIVPLRTKQYDVLQGIDLHPSSLIPISALESGANSSAANSKRPGSMFSSRMSTTTSGFGSGRIQFSICDTPGIDFEMEDDYEIERKVSSAIRYLEQRLGKTLSEENKVQRQPRGDGLVHLVLYFIDPRLIIERAQTRKELQLRARQAAARSLKIDRQQQEQSQKKRTRSTSMIGNTSNPHSVNNAGLSKQAQTAQLRQSMEVIQARSSPSKQRHESKGSKGSIATLEAAVELPPFPSKTSNDLKGGSQTNSTVETDDNKYDLDDDNLEGLSQQQLSILSRLSERANVLPIIAKADTLTQVQLEEVRTAVRESILKAKIDLGAFDMEGKKHKRKTSKEQRKTHTKSDQIANSADTQTELSNDTATPGSSQDSALNTEPVKVIRIKSRRSYSASAGDRIARSGSGHSFGGHNALESRMDDGHNTFEHTTPLFDEQRKSFEREEDEDDTIPLPEAFSKLIPFTLFVPEPIRIRAKQVRSTIRSTTNSQRPNGLQRIGSMNSIAENLPPVPKLPENIANMNRGSMAHEDLSFEQKVDEEKEILTAEDGQEASRQSLESASVHPSAATIKSDEEPVPNLPTSATNNSLSCEPPLPSMRFQREFRFGNANVLDSRQCDFSLLRTCMLGSHVEKIRELTNERYEHFRSQRLELSRRLTKQVE